MGTCILKETGVNINFGVGEIAEINTGGAYFYQRVFSTCPTDGHYAYIPYTSDCFRGDWITLDEDHTPGDMSGNMLVVNSSYRRGNFFNTTVSGLKPGVNYEFSLWALNLCKPSDKCPYPLLPDITIQMRTPEGKMVLEMNMGELKRFDRPQWARFDMMFVMPGQTNSLDIALINHSPGGCGNDFAIDDFSFRECVLTPPPVTKKSTTIPQKKKPPSSATTRNTGPTAKENPPGPPAVIKKGAAAKPIPKTTNLSSTKKENSPATVTSPARKADTIQRRPVFPPPPPPIANRSNPVAKNFEVAPGTITIELFDNGQIDGDTVSVYHNNRLILSRVRLSGKAIIFNIVIDQASPHHELVMVANNLGSIPPNTSLMYVTAGAVKYELFISSTEKQNAKVIFDLVSPK